MTEEQKHELILEFGSMVDMAVKTYNKKTERKAFYWRAIGIKSVLYILDIKIPSDLLELLKEAEEDLKL